MEQIMNTCFGIVFQGLGFIFDLFEGYIVANCAICFAGSRQMQLRTTWSLQCPVTVVIFH